MPAAELVATLMEEIVMHYRTIDTYEAS